MFGSDFLLKTWKKQDSYWTVLQKVFSVDKQYCRKTTRVKVPNPWPLKKNLLSQKTFWKCLGYFDMLVQDVWPLKPSPDLTPIHSKRFASFQQKSKKSTTFIFIFNFFGKFQTKEDRNTTHNSTWLSYNFFISNLPPVVERRWSQPSLECYRSGTWKTKQVKVDYRRKLPWVGWKFNNVCIPF